MGRMNILRKVVLQTREESPVKWLDEALEDDGVEIEEWAFWNGYYNEE